MRTARSLLGKMLCRRMPDGEIIRAKIVEVELYHESERACHAYQGKRTEHNAPMFLDGGHAYVYLCYGIHNMLNIVLGPADTAVAVLVRAVEIDGGQGPGMLTRRMAITQELNGCDLCTGDQLWLEDGPRPLIIGSGIRVGIDYAGADAKLPWRYFARGSEYLSQTLIPRRR